MLDDFVFWFEGWRGWICAALAAVAIAVAYLVTTGDEVEPPEGPAPLSLAAAAERTESHAGGRLKIRGQLEGGGVKADIIAGKGVYNQETGRFALRLHGVAGSPVPPSFDYAQVAQERGGTFVSYLRSSEFGLPSSSPWVEVDYAKRIRAQSLDSRGHLGILRSTTKYFNLGVDTIRGAETRHVRAIIDLKEEARLLRREGEKGAANALEVLIAATGGRARRYEMELWIGGDMTIHRYRLEVVCPAERVPTSRMIFTVDLYDFGIEPDIPLPSKGEVYGGPGLDPAATERIIA